MTNHTGVLGTAIASPVVITLWVAVLFGVGVADFLIEKYLHGHKYTMIAGVPIALGFIFVSGTFYIGGLLGNNLASQKTSPDDASDTTQMDRQVQVQLRCHQCSQPSHTLKLVAIRTSDPTVQQIPTMRVTVTDRTY